MLYMNTDYNICKGYDPFTPSYYNESVSDFFSLFIFTTITFIFLILAEGEVRTTPTKKKFESSEQLCKK